MGIRNRILVRTTCEVKFSGMPDIVSVVRTLKRYDRKAEMKPDEWKWTGVENRV